MKNSTLICSLAVVVLSAMISPVAKAQILFNFEFNKSSDATLATPIIGTGTFSLNVDPGDGTFDYNVLDAPTSSFTLYGINFTNDDLVSDPSLTTVILSTEGNLRRIQFSDTGAGGGGPYGGSIDFQDVGGDSISFEPSYAGQGLNLYTFNNLLGTYQGLTQATPEPGSVAFLIGFGVTAAGMALKRRRRT